MKLSILRKVLASCKRNGRTTVQARDGELSIQSGKSYNPTTITFNNLATGNIPSYFDGGDLQAALKSHTGALLSCYDDRLITDSGDVALSVLDDCDRWELIVKTINGSDLALKHSAVKKSMRCAANNDVRYYLNGIAVYENGGIVSTDGHRIYYDYTPKVDERPVGIIPRHVAELLTATGSDAVLRFCGLDATITGDWFTITFKFTDGKYPLLDRFITDARAMAIVNRKQLLKECKRLLPAANKKYKGCRVAVNEVVALDVCNGFTGSVDCESIADCNFGINLAYMIDALSSSADEMITIAANLESESNDVTDTIQFQSTKHTTIVLPMLM